MKLYVIRHAAAAPAGEGSDFGRPLTGLGRLQARAAGRALRERGAAWGAILASPAARAAETAELIAAEFDPAPVLETVESLYGGTSPPSLLEALRPWEGKGDLALVGHLPFVEHLVLALLSQTADLRFPAGAICCLEFDSVPVLAQGRLAWLLPPA